MVEAHFNGHSLSCSPQNILTIKHVTQVTNIIKTLSLHLTSCYSSGRHTCQQQISVKYIKLAEIEVNSKMVVCREKEPAFSWETGQGGRYLWK